MSPSALQDLLLLLFPSLLDLRRFVEKLPEGKKLIDEVPEGLGRTEHAHQVATRLVAWGMAERTVQAPGDIGELSPRGHSELASALSRRFPLRIREIEAVFGPGSIAASPVATVYLSFAEEDTDRAKVVAGALAGIGVSTRSSVPGDDDRLGDAQVMLILWSRAAAGSPLVLRDRHAALAREAAGKPLKVAIGRLDETEVPARRAGEGEVDLSKLAETVRAWLRPAVPSDLDGVARRIRRAEVRREGTLEAILENLEAGQHTVVFVARKAGTHTLLRQLVGELRRRHPDWCDVAVPADAVGNEDEGAYRERLRGLLPQEGRRRSVAILHGWSKAPRSHQEVLGALLRQRAEATVERPLLVVAVGGLPVYRQRYGGGDWSLLNGARPVFLPELSEEEVGQTLAQAGPGPWTGADVAGLERLSGGHPHLLKVLLAAWARAPRQGLSEAEKALEEDQDFLVPTFSRLSGDEEMRRALRMVLEAGRVRFPKFGVGSPLLRLYFEGLLVRRGGDLGFRCPAVERMAGEVVG